MSTDLPPAIETYQRAHDRGEVDAAVATFTPDATVTDDGASYVGTDRIRWWLGHAASEYTYSRSLIGVDDLGGGAYLVRNHLDGDFPGGQVDLSYRFELRDGLIERLEIAPEA